MSLAAVLKWVDFAKTILPYTLAAAGVPAEKIQPTVVLVGEAESALGPGKGTEKLQHVVNGLAAGMQASGASQETIDATVGAVTAGINDGIDLTNKVHAVSAAHAAGAPPAVAPAPEPTTPVDPAAHNGLSQSTANPTT